MEHSTQNRTDRFSYLTFFTSVPPFASPDPLIRAYFAMYTYLPCSYNCSHCAHTTPASIFVLSSKWHIIKRTPICIFFFFPFVVFSPGWVYKCREQKRELVNGKGGGKLKMGGWEVFCAPIKRQLLCKGKEVMSCRDLGSSPLGEYNRPLCPRNSYRLVGKKGFSF